MIKVFQVKKVHEDPKEIQEIKGTLVCPVYVVLWVSLDLRVREGNLEIKVQGDAKVNSESLVCQVYLGRQDPLELQGQKEWLVLEAQLVLLAREDARVHQGFRALTVFQDFQVQKETQGLKGTRVLMDQRGIQAFKDQGVIKVNGVDLVRRVKRAKVENQDLEEYLEIQVQKESKGMLGCLVLLAHQVLLA